tara:strand:+ start:176 stop:736 length:561 start_codon:yes stop_codon:yes gene_type:complete
MKTFITTVPERSHYLDHFREKLSDPIFVYDEVRSAMDTFLRALAKVNNEPAFLFQDDAIIANNFEKQASPIVRDKPLSLIQFFSMRNADIDIGSRWDNNFLMLQGIYIPPNMSAALIHFHSNYWVPNNCEGHKPVSALDSMVCSYLKKTKQKYWIVVPNLVDHKAGPSAIDSRRSSTSRVSKTFEG